MPNLLPQPYAGTRIAFRLVYPDIQGSNRPGAQGRYISRDIGSVIVGARTANEDGDMGDEVGATVAEALKQLNGDPDKTLSDAKFLIGDYQRHHQCLDPEEDRQAHTADVVIMGLDAAGEEEAEEDMTTEDLTTTGDTAEVYHRVSGGGAKHRQSESLATAEEEEAVVVLEEGQMATGMAEEGEDGDLLLVNVSRNCGQHD
ncbi:uncharacterized protein EKO05_0006812 [Ascochyta rabiei]|uniref:uncharacterized protein n=1 Tax=Didymella rabiei TaxID=5454 RepID=UPI0021FC66D6|nr:uncharacterized protein EKO05_0006812 [Ascochyta rabiei]UPX16411.1 hypothetical protein EKO05_0006812 [Ascochyta rabiei]